MKGMEFLLEWWQCSKTDSSDYCETQYKLFFNKAEQNNKGRGILRRYIKPLIPGK